MKKLLIILAIFLGITAAYYGIWRYALSDDVARVKASIDYHNQQFRAKNRWVTLKADAVKPAGFPFSGKVRVTRPTLTLVWGDETYGASIPWVELSLRDSTSGAYAVEYSPYVEAVYAKSGQAPEEYKVTPKEPLAVLLRAQPESRVCMNIPGSVPCKAVAATDPLISFAVQLPSTLTITMELNGKSKDTSFKLVPLNMPIYMRIPAAADRPLEIFVNMLREALVFQK